MFRNLLRIFTSKPARGAVSLGLLIFILYKFGAGKILANILSADPLFFALAVLVFIVSGIAGAKQWGILLAFHGIRLGFRGTVSRYFMGLFFNYVLPGFVGGDIIRVYQAAKASGKATSAFSSTLADRVMGLLILVLFSLGGFLFLPSGPSMEALPVAVFMFLVLCGFIGLFALRPAGRIINRTFGRFLPGEIRLKLSAVYYEMHHLTRAPSILLAILGIFDFHSAHPDRGAFPLRESGRNRTGIHVFRALCAAYGNNRQHTHITGRGGSTGDDGRDSFFHCRGESGHHRFLYTFGVFLRFHRRTAGKYCFYDEHTEEKEEVNVRGG